MKKIPLRKCTGCGEMKPKRELIRVVRSPEKTDENGGVTEESVISQKSRQGRLCLQKRGLL